MTENLTPAEVKRLKALALTMPKWNDFIVDEYQQNPEWAKHRVASELDEYAKTGEIKYLLATLKDVATARGWVQLAKETGLGRTTLYETLSGKNRPRIDTLAKILGALGFRMLFVAVDNTQPQKTRPASSKRKMTARKTPGKTVAVG